MTMAVTDASARAVVAALLGAAIGWGGNALTVGGRVSAIEAALVRIEARLYVAAPAAPGAAK